MEQKVRFGKDKVEKILTTKKPIHLNSLIEAVEDNSVTINDVCSIVRKRVVRNMDVLSAFMNVYEGNLTVAQINKIFETTLNFDKIIRLYPNLANTYVDNLDAGKFYPRIFLFPLDMYKKYTDKIEIYFDELMDIFSSTIKFNKDVFMNLLELTFDHVGDLYAAHINHLYNKFVLINGDAKENWIISDAQHEVLKQKILNLDEHEEFIQQLFIDHCNSKCFTVSTPKYYTYFEHLNMLTAEKSFFFIIHFDAVMTYKKNGIFTFKTINLKYCVPDVIENMAWLFEDVNLINIIDPEVLRIYPFLSMYFVKVSNGNMCMMNEDICAFPMCHREDLLMNIIDIKGREVECDDSILMAEEIWTYIKSDQRLHDFITHNS